MNNMKILLVAISLLAGSCMYAQPYRLIAHRGGLVDSKTPENSRASLQKAIQQKFWMVEIDLRITADSVLITQHDRTFKRYFGLDSAVSSLNWTRIRELRSDAGTKVMNFEEVLQQCKGKIHVMIDTKIQGFDQKMFQGVIDLLDKYDLRKNALIIPTDESTEFFRGKIRLSCTRKRLEEYKLRPDFNPDHYYLFSSQISREDVLWAQKEKIMVVGVLNHRFPESPEALEKMKTQAAALIASGVTIFQLDAPFRKLLN